MTEAVDGVKEQSSKRIGWGLMALAIASPVLMSAIGVISAYKAGELTVYVGVAWLAAAIVTDLFTRKRSATSKANGRILAAGLAFMVAGAAVFNDYRDAQKIDTAKKELIEQFMVSTVGTKPTSDEVAKPAVLSTVPQQPSVPIAQHATAGTSDADKAVGVLNAMKARAKQFAEESAEIDRRFNAIDLSSVLVAQNLVSKLSIDSSRKKLNAYKAAIADRDAMLKNHFVLSEQIIRNSGMNQRDVSDGMAGLNSNKGPITQNYADLTTAQLASVTAIEGILNFAERNLGRITDQGGQAMFQTQAELDEYRQLFQVLTDAVAVETAITQKVQAQAQQSKQALVDQLK